MNHQITRFVIELSHYQQHQCSFHRFEAEISTPSSSSNPFVPSQLRPIIGSNTYSQVQQKLQLHPPPTISKPPTTHQLPNRLPPMTTAPPSFMPTFLPPSMDQQEKSYSSEPTPVILSSAPKLYTNRPMSIQPNEYPSYQAPQLDITSIQFDVTQKLKKLKAEKSGPNPIAEAAIQAAKASSALQNFQLNEKRKKDKKVSSQPGCDVLHTIYHYLSQRLIADHAHGWWPSMGGPLVVRLGWRWFPDILWWFGQWCQRWTAYAYLQQICIVHAGESHSR